VLPPSALFTVDSFPFIPFHTSCECHGWGKHYVFLFWLFRSVPFFILWTFLEMQFIPFHTSCNFSPFRYGPFRSFLSSMSWLRKTLFSCFDRSAPFRSLSCEHVHRIKNILGDAIYSIPYNLYGMEERNGAERSKQENRVFLNLDIDDRKERNGP